MCQNRCFVQHEVLFLALLRLIASSKNLDSELEEISAEHVKQAVFDVMVHLTPGGLSVVVLYKHHMSYGLDTLP